jgi:hypothetical protein
LELGDLAVEGDFEAEQEFVGANALVAGAKGFDGALGGIFGGGGDGGDVIVEVGLLDAPNSPLPPVGRDYGFHQQGLGGRGGFMLVQKFIEELMKLGGVFGFQD